MSALREAIGEPIEAVGRYIVESITLMPTNVKLKKLNKKQAVNTILNAVIAALPKEKQIEYTMGADITIGENKDRFYHYGGYDLALREVKSILEEAKKS